MKLIRIGYYLNCITINYRDESISKGSENNMIKYNLGKKNNIRFQTER